MANDQFQFPQIREESSDSTDQLRHQIDELFDTPETKEILQEFERFGYIKDIENEIGSMRATATEENLPKKGIKGALVEKAVQIASPRALEERLVNAEAEIGGRLIPEMEGIVFKRFFFHGGYWYLELQDKSGRQVVSYQITESAAYKLFEGREVAFDSEQNELDNLLTMISLYVKEIKLNMYEREVERNTRELDAKIEAIYEQEQSDGTEIEQLDDELDHLLREPNIKEVLTKDDVDLAA